jgi:hypothetical protein
MFHVSCSNVSKNLGLASEPIGRSIVQDLARKASMVRIAGELRYRRRIVDRVYDVHGLREA